MDQFNKELDDLTKSTNNDDLNKFLGSLGINLSGKDTDDDDEDYDEVRDVYCMVDAPVSLLHEFDQEKFYKWILTKDAELRKRKLADAKEKFKTLLDEFPELKNWN